MKKRCTKCRHEFEATAENFKPLRSAKDGLSSWCRDCTSKDAKRAYAILKKDLAAYGARQLRLRNGHLWRKYKITGEQYDKMLADQSGLCAICRSEPKLPARGTIPVFYVDHDHQTEAVRGLLCHDCNTLLGNAKDSEHRLEAALAYLRRSRCEVPV